MIVEFLNYESYKSNNITYSKAFSICAENIHYFFKAIITKYCIGLVISDCTGNLTQLRLSFEEIVQ